MTNKISAGLALDESWISQLLGAVGKTIHNRSTRNKAVLLPVAITERLVSLDALAVIPKRTNAYYY